MILFLNFAPISFMGGAEKWMNETAKKVSKYEETSIISTSPEIANLYGSLVLKRKFEKRTTEKIHNHTSITYLSLVPFSSEWKKIRRSFVGSRLIYSKYELLEILIILYFGGLSSFKKTIAGIHSPFLYNSPQGFFSNLHNLIYGSSINSKVLSSLYKVHVLNKRDASLMKISLKLGNVVYVPNGAESVFIKKTTKNDNKILKILTVGELSQRKGTDILIGIISSSPRKFKFTIVGDGPMKDRIISTEKNNTNVKYVGFVKPKDVAAHYDQNDVLLLPSRAESMSLAVLEAMANGLIILNSKETSLDLNRKVEYSSESQDPKNYISILNKLYEAKLNEKLDKAAIQKYFVDNFSSQIVNPLMLTNIFELEV